ncbi:hypothetical protein SCHPADRAFT_947164 [Schizopora paradoxa]|uniref:Uncharacterized protein n=1 Tax=Schizopora paradoxa TaxID=27342 RepID=A0A0H2R025_9AGAM|nr:hypothetical protein SCHPADRAFT_947164 [Schizopora paradoxa]
MHPHAGEEDIITIYQAGEYLSPSSTRQSVIEILSDSDDVADTESGDSSLDSDDPGKFWVGNATFKHHPTPKAIIRSALDLPPDNDHSAISTPSRCQEVKFEPHNASSPMPNRPGPRIDAARPRAVSEAP